MAHQRSVIFTWISLKDIQVARASLQRREGNRATNPETKGQFSILLKDPNHRFNEIVALYNKDASDIAVFKNWCDRFTKKITFWDCGDVDAKDYRSIYAAVTKLLEKYRNVQRGYLVSGGSKAMGLVWVFVHVDPLYTGTLYNAYDLDDGHSGEIRPMPLPFKVDATYLGDQFQKQTLEDWNQLNAFNHIVAESDEMKETYRLAYQGARLQIPIIVLGESGTGKELVATYCAEAADRPKIYPINCGAIPKNLVESELFGHVRGAFTDASIDKKGLFEEARGQTLFLDEIGELPLEAQAKLLRVLQEKKIRRVGSTKEIPVDVFIIAATNRQLHLEVEAGRFREDLYYRLMIWPITLLPLRHRAPIDRRKLVKFLWDKILDHLTPSGKPPHKTIPKSIIDELVNHPWPGNIRQLENALIRLYGMSFGGEISRDMIHHILRQPVPFSDSIAAGPGLAMEPKLALAFVTHFEEVYNQKQSQRETATALDMDVNTMMRNYEKYCHVLGKRPIIGPKSQK